MLDIFQAQQEVKQELQQQHNQREQYKRQQFKEQSQRIQARQQQELDKAEQILNAKRQFRTQQIHENYQRFVFASFCCINTFFSVEDKLQKAKPMTNYVSNKMKTLVVVTIECKHVNPKIRKQLIIS